MKAKLILLFLPLLVFSCNFQQKLANHDLASNFHPKSLVVNSVFFNCNNQNNLLLSFSNEAKLTTDEFFDKYDFSYFTVQNYNTSTASLAGPLTIVDSGSNQNSIWLKAKFPSLVPEENILVLELEEKSEQFLELIDIPLPDILFTNPVLLYDSAGKAPVLTNYLNANKSYYPKFACQISDQFTINFYQSDTLPALPPMNTTVKSNSVILYSSLNQYENTTFKIGQTGVINISSTGSDTTWYLVTSNQFPHITSIEDMVKPLIYITTDSEYYTLCTQSNLKIAIDSFWLNVGGNKEYTRKLIKAFYERVEFANTAFTTVKEGWKTDKGMVYIIFGPPDEVFKYNTREEWIYHLDPKTPVVFTFKKTPELAEYGFTALERRPEYIVVWQQMVEKIRKGTLMK